MKRKGRDLMDKIEKIVVRDKAKSQSTLWWILGIIGAVVTIAGIAYAVYRFVLPKYLERYDDEFEEDFEDEFFEEEM